MRETGRFRIGVLSFDSATGELIGQRKVRRLEPRAASVLTALSVADGSIVSRQELLDRCWGDGMGSDEALTQAISQIRRAFEELGEAPTMLETLAKRGYRLRNETPTDPAV